MRRIQYGKAAAVDALGWGHGDRLWLCGGTTGPIPARRVAAVRKLSTGKGTSDFPRLDCAPVRFDEPSPQLELRDQLAVIRRRKWLVLGTAALSAVLAVALAIVQKPVYAATAELLPTRHDADPVLGTSRAPVIDPDRVIRSEAALLKSEQIRAEVRMKLGFAPSISTSIEADSDLIRVTAKRNDAVEAARVANAYSEAYVDFRRREAADELNDAAERLQPKVDDLERQIESLNAQIETIPVTERAINGQALIARRDAVVTQLVQAQQRVTDLGVAASLQDGGARLVTPARPPSVPSSPKPVMNATLGLVLGLIGGLALAFVREYFTDSVSNKKELERLRLGVDVLGAIPVFAKTKGENDIQLVAATERFGAAAEAYRQLRTSLQATAFDRSIGVLQVTSPFPMEGKTTTVANLAVSLADAGLRVLVVDCDLRHPRLHTLFGLSNDIGFTSVLTSRESLATAIRPVPNFDRIHLLASGPVPPNPSELLASRRTDEVLRTPLDRFDMVVIDSPPVVPVTDAAVLARWVEAVMLIASARRTNGRQLTRAVEILSQAKAPLVGIVMNHTDAAATYGYGNGYSAYRPEVDVDAPTPRVDGRPIW